jgi:hypothetical protein
MTYALGWKTMHSRRSQKGAWTHLFAKGHGDCKAVTYEPPDDVVVLGVREWDLLGDIDPVLNFFVARDILSKSI